MIALHENPSSHDALRIFDRLSASELAIYIRRFGISALPRLTNHTQRVKEAMRFCGSDDPKALADAVAEFQKRFDAIQLEKLRAYNPAVQRINKSGGPRTVELYACQCCGERFRPFKFQITRGNGLFCGSSECRRAARKGKAVAA